MTKLQAWHKTEDQWAHFEAIDGWPAQDAYSMSIRGIHKSGMMRACLCYYPEHVWKEASMHLARAGVQLERLAEILNEVSECGGARVMDQELKFPDECGFYGTTVYTALILYFLEQA